MIAVGIFSNGLKGQARDLDAYTPSPHYYFAISLTFHVFLCFLLLLHSTWSPIPLGSMSSATCPHGSMASFGPMYITPLVIGMRIFNPTPNKLKYVIWVELDGSTWTRAQPYRQYDPYPLSFLFSALTLFIASCWKKSNQRILREFNLQEGGSKNFSSNVCIW